MVKGTISLLGDWTVEMIDSINLIKEDFPFIMEDIFTSENRSVVFMYDSIMVYMFPKLNNCIVSTHWENLKQQMYTNKSLLVFDYTRPCRDKQLIASRTLGIYDNRLVTLVESSNMQEVEGLDL